MMRWFRADLHVHTLLSPCAAIEMTPRNIIRHAQNAGIDIVAITDHNAGDNVVAALRASEGTGVTVLPGMEVQTREEVHLVTLFAKMRDFAKWCRIISLHRSTLRNDEKKFGAQFVVDEKDNWIRTEDSMLLASTDLGIDEVTEQVLEMGGLVIAAHVDRPAYSLLSQLGFFPPNVRVSAVEVSRNTPWDKARERFSAIGEIPVVASSDGHTIDDVVNGPKTMFLMEAPILFEIRQALAQKEGRRIHQ